MTAATVTARAAAAVKLAQAADQLRELASKGKATLVDADRLKDALRAYEQATWVEEER